MRRTPASDARAQAISGCRALAALSGRSARDRRFQYRHEVHSARRRHHRPGWCKSFFERKTGQAPLGFAGYRGSLGSAVNISSPITRLSSLGYERVGQALRLCLRFLVKIKAVPARTCTARELGLDLGEQTLNTKGAGLHGWLVARVDESEITGLAATKLWIDFSKQREGPAGTGLLQLLYGLSGQPLPPTAKAPRASRIRFSTS
jgi:hypothetical protein